MARAAFDRIASQYDELWTRTPVGQLQREAVWRRLGRLFHRGDRLLDLGCGTGEDALHLAGLGMDVRAIDASPEMVRIARGRGVDASVLGIEEIGSLAGSYDGAVSNFGALNCVRDLEGVRRGLAGLIRPGGHLALCVIGRFCLWETLWYALHGQPRKSGRRWGSEQFSGSLQIPVHFFSIRRLARAFSPEFALREWRGIGTFVPPSYVRALPPRSLGFLAGLDRRVAHLRFLRALADHRLLIFVRRR
jgi:SAM-dependent methyltransferase